MKAFSVHPSTVLIIPSYGVFNVHKEGGGEIRNCTFLIMNVPPWLLWTIGFVARQQWKMKRR